MIARGRECTVEEASLVRFEVDWNKTNVERKKERPRLKRSYVRSKKEGSEGREISPLIA